MNVTVTESRQVQLTDEEALRVARAVIRQKFDLPEHPTIKDGGLHTSYRDGGGAHSWISTDRVREATDLDVAAVRVLAALT